jgi:hypothetical protein
MRPLVTIPLHIRAWHSRRQVCRSLQYLQTQQLAVPTLLLQVQLTGIGIGPTEQQQQQEQEEVLGTTTMDSATTTAAGSATVAPAAKGVGPQERMVCPAGAAAATCELAAAVEAVRPVFWRGTVRCTLGIWRRVLMSMC